MGGAWKESTSNGPRQSSPPPIVAPWRRPCLLAPFLVPGHLVLALSLCFIMLYFPGLALFYDSVLEGRYS